MAQLNEEDQAQLVAYLDGELDEDEAQAFEARLSRDRQLRAEAEALKKTWELLDFLPRAEPSANFTHRTLERLTVHGGVGAQSALPWLRRSLAAPAVWVAAMVLAVVGGLAAGRFFAPMDSSAPPLVEQQDVEAAIIRDLGVIRNQRLYQNVESLEELRKLAKVFNEEGNGQ